MTTRLNQYKAGFILVQRKKQSEQQALNLTKRKLVTETPNLTL